MNIATCGGVDVATYRDVDIATCGGVDIATSGVSIYLQQNFRKRSDRETILQQDSCHKLLGV